MTTTLAALDFAAVGNVLLAVVIFALAGIILMFVGYKLFDAINTRIDFQKELAEKQNLPLAIVIASVIVSIAAIIIAAMLI
jgi:hypothetical protein